MLTENIKKAPFKKGDIIVYLALIILVVTLFLVTLLPQREINGFTVTVGGKTVLYGDFLNNSVKISKVDWVEKIDENTYKIISQSGYNTIKIDWQNKDVVVIETDCGISKECTYMRLKNGDVICVPHQMIISRTGEIPKPVVG